MIDLTPVIAAEMSVARLELPSDENPILQNSSEDNDLGWVDVLELDPLYYDWDMRESRFSGDKQPHVILRVLDDAAGVVKAAVLASESVAYDGWRWKLSRQTEPFGNVRMFTLRLDRAERLPQPVIGGVGYGNSYGTSYGN